MKQFFPVLLLLASASAAMADSIPLAPSSHPLLGRGGVLRPRYRVEDSNDLLRFLSVPRAGTLNPAPTRDPGRTVGDQEPRRSAGDSHPAFHPFSQPGGFRVGDPPRGPKESGSWSGPHRDGKDPIRCVVEQVKPFCPGDREVPGVEGTGVVPTPEPGPTLLLLGALAAMAIRRRPPLA